MKHRIISIILIVALVCLPLSALADAFTPSDYMMYYPDSYSYITAFATALNIGGGSLSSVNWSECDVVKSKDAPVTYGNRSDDFTITFGADSESEEAGYAQLVVTNQSTPAIYAFPFVATFMTYGRHLDMEDFMQALGWVASLEVEKPGAAGSTYETSSYYMAGVQPGGGSSLAITVVNKGSELSRNYAELRKGSKGDAVKALQEQLNAAGYSVGTVDGDFGGKTATAISDFQKDMLLPQTGTLDLATYTLLNSGASSASDASTSAEPVQSAAESSQSAGWYVSDDGKYAIYPEDLRKNSDGSYSVNIQIREEASKIVGGYTELNLGQESLQMSLSENGAIQNFINEGGGNYSFDVVCDVRSGGFTFQRRSNFSLTIG